MSAAIQLDLTAYDEGREAREHGIAPIANPYKHNDPRRESWAAGWSEAGPYFLRAEECQDSY